MKVRTVFLAFLVGGAMLVFPLAGFAQTTYTFWASEDAWVNGENPTANYGNNTYLSVKDRSGLGESYIKFGDLSSLAGQNIAGASLFLYQYMGNYSGGDTINAHRVNSDWSEAGINWNSRPGYTGATVSSLNLTAGNLQWREWPGLEGLVGSWVNGTNYGLALENNLDGASEELLARFYSSEYSDPSLRPYLRVTVTPEPIAATLFLLGGGILSFIPKIKAGKKKPNTTAQVILGYRKNNSVSLPGR
jgi:hypothetical protein